MHRRAEAPAASGAALPGAAYRIVLLAVLAVLILSSIPLHAKESASSFYKQGENAEAREDYDTAYDCYQKAANKAPSDLTYRTALYRVRVTASGMHMTRGRKLLRPVKSRERWRSLFTPRRSIRAMRLRSRRSPGFASARRGRAGG